VPTCALLRVQDDVTHLAALSLRNRYPTANDGYFGRSTAGGAPTTTPLALVASASADATVRIWSASWTCLRILTVSLSRMSASASWSSGLAGLASLHSKFRAGGTSSLGPVSHTGLLPGVTAADHAVPALSVVMSRSMVAAGYGDSSIRMWHVDELYQVAADFMGVGSASTGLGGGLSSQALDELLAAHVASSGLSGGLSPPMSPTTAAAAALLLERASSGVPRLDGTGTGKPCARLAAAAAAVCTAAGEQACAAAGNGRGGSADSSSIAATGAASSQQQQPADERAAAGLVRPASPFCATLLSAAAAGCMACGSQDQQLVRSLREFVAIRSVSADMVSAGNTPAPDHSNS
jgi:hypothetical protein